MLAAVLKAGRFEPNLLSGKSGRNLAHDKSIAQNQVICAVLVLGKGPETNRKLGGHAK